MKTKIPLWQIALPFIGGSVAILYAKHKKMHAGLLVGFTMLGIWKGGFPMFYHLLTDIEATTKKDVSSIEATVSGSDINNVSSNVNTMNKS